MCGKCQEFDSGIPNRKRITGAASILRTVNDGVYICLCSFGYY